MPAALPDQVIATLLDRINRRFYRTAPASRWMQDKRHLTGIVTWPATWLVERGISLPLDRYQALLGDILTGIEQHGDTAIKFFPAYLERTVKAWFAHNGEALYTERKALRNALDFRALAAAGSANVQAPDPIEALAAANRVLATASRRTKAAKKDDLQGSLFDL